MSERPLRPPEDGPISGRFLVCGRIEFDLDGCPGLAPEPDPETEISHEPCTDTPPFGTDLSECRHRLAYASFPGPSILFVKETDRTPTRVQVDQALRALLPWPIDAVPREERAVWKEKARRAASQRVEPRTRILQVLVFSDRLLVSCRTVGAELSSFLSSWLGAEFVPDPVLWRSTESHGAMLLAALSEQIRLESEGRASIDLPFKVEEASLSCGKSRVRGPIHEASDTLGSFLESRADEEVVVEQMVVRIRVPNGRCRLHVDPDGLFRAEVPESRGGMPVDRIGRRFRDLDRSVAEARKELLASLTRAMKADG